MSAEIHFQGLTPFTQHQPHAFATNENGEITQLELQIHQVSLTGFTICQHTWTLKEISQNTRLAKQTGGLPLNIQFFHCQEQYAITDARLTYTESHGCRIVRSDNTPIKTYLEGIPQVSSISRNALVELEKTLNGTHNKQRQLIELVVSITRAESPRCQQLRTLLHTGVNLNIGRLAAVNPLTSALFGFFSPEQKSALENTPTKECSKHTDCMLYTRLNPLCDTILKSGKVGVVDIAILTGNKISLGILLEQDIDFESINFGIAFRLNQKGPNNLKDIIELLIEHGLPLHTVIEEALPLLHWACSRQLFAIVESLVETHHYDVNATNALEVTPIMSALGSPSPEIITFLLQKGANVDAISEKLGGDTALHLMARLNVKTWNEDITGIFVSLISEKPQRLVVLNQDQESPLSILIAQNNLEPLMSSAMRKACNTLSLPSEALKAQLNQAIKQNNIDLFEILLSFNPEIQSDVYQKGSLLDTILLNGSSDIVALTMKYLKAKNQSLAREYHECIVAILTDKNQPENYPNWVECFKFTDSQFIHMYPKVRTQFEGLYLRSITSWHTNHLDQLVQLANDRYVTDPIDFTELLNQFIGNISTNQTQINWYHIEAFINHIDSQSLINCNIEELLNNLLTNIQKSSTSLSFVYINEQSALRSISTLLNMIAKKHNGELPAGVCSQLTDFIKATHPSPIFDITLKLLNQCPQFLHNQQLLFQELAMHAVARESPKLFIALLKLTEKCQIDLTTVLEAKVTPRENVMQKMVSLNNQSKYKLDIEEIRALVVGILVAKQIRMTSGSSGGLHPQKIILKQNEQKEVNTGEFLIVSSKDAGSDDEQ